MSCTTLLAIIMTCKDKAKLCAKCKCLQRVWQKRKRRNPARWEMTLKSPWNQILVFSWNIVIFIINDLSFNSIKIISPPSCTKIYSLLVMSNLQTNCSFGQFSAFWIEPSQMFCGSSQHRSTSYSTKTLSDVADTQLISKHIPYRHVMYGSSCSLRPSVFSEDSVFFQLFSIRALR